MDNLRQYCNQLFSSAFQRKSNLCLLHEKIQSCPEGLFFSVFQTGQHSLAYEENFGAIKNFPYHAYHLFFGNSSDKIAYISASDLSYDFQNIVHKKGIEDFCNIAPKIQDKIVGNLSKINNYQGLSSLEEIQTLTKKIIPTFIFPDDQQYYRELHCIFSHEKLNLMLPPYKVQRIQDCQSKNDNFQKIQKI